jgi:hypothetical protein
VLRGGRRTRRLLSLDYGKCGGARKNKCGLNFQLKHAISMRVLGQKWLENRMGIACSA